MKVEKGEVRRAKTVSKLGRERRRMVRVSKSIRSELIQAGGGVKGDKKRPMLKRMSSRLNSKGHIFDGQVLHRDVANYQLIDITDPLLYDLIHDPRARKDHVDVSTWNGRRRPGNRLRHTLTLFTLSHSRSPDGSIRNNSTRSKPFFVVNGSQCLTVEHAQTKIVLISSKNSKISNLVNRQADRSAG
jgi:hypothetical protein